MQEVSIFWFRRDLRIQDNAGLYHALKGPYPVIPIFIFDTDILHLLEDKQDRRVQFIHESIEQLQAQFIQQGASLEVYHGKPIEVFEEIVKKYTLKQVYTNRDYEPGAILRDESIANRLAENGISFHHFKDQVIFEATEVLKDDGKPYTVFTPYSKKWKALLKPFHLKAYPTERYLRQLFKQAPQSIPTLQALGFEKGIGTFPASTLQEELVRKYAQQRDIPAIAGTSKLGVHLRFGTISIRQIALEAQSWSETFLNELIWRDFYHMILSHFPQVGQGKAFKPLYDTIEWRKDNGEFERWCQGKTGYPIVDAGMRELNATGFMHNRVRMIVASFLSKHLLLDWRLGEAYFAAKLLDFDLAANNGGWQWAAGSGCDAAPYFRIFNPYLQTQKFDPQLHYIRKWVPELDSFDYPQPIVQHEFARKRCLEIYGKALKPNIE